MASPGLEARLVGHGPMGGNQSVCASSMNYLDPGSQPATGLFLRKLTAQFSCGSRMPLTGRIVSATDLACIQSWANGLTM
jgi:hypothetical protein